MNQILNNLFQNAFTKKRWHNISDFCNRKTHPGMFPYRRYRRGKTRCVICGAKIGKIKCVYKSNQEMIVDNIYGETPLLNLLRRKGYEKES